MTITEIVENRADICTEDHFVGIGSTRKVYRWKDFVVKVNLHSIGHQQSIRELEIYEYMQANGFGELFAPTYYVDEEICIQQYFPELPMMDHQSYDIHEQSEFQKFPNKYKECVELLDEKFDIFDIKDSSNYGLNERSELVFIDYGMSKKLYEDAWVPAAENGEIPQIDVLACDKCGIVKEIRMYGEADSLIRCHSCGKE